MEIVLLFLALAAFAAWAFGQPLWQGWRRARLMRRPFPEHWRRLLRRRVPAYRRLPPVLQQQLRGWIQVFLAEKPIIGCRGLVVDDEVRVTIAAQACLLLLGRAGPAARAWTQGCYPRLRQVLVYPGAFAVERLHTDNSGIVQDRRLALAGESWSQGQVILSWADTLEGARLPDDGCNVVIHEFAHQLDQENGPANGAPLIQGQADRRRWAAVMATEFEHLRHRLDQREPTLLNAYGAQDPAEFFAVASEVFFEQPRQMAEEHPALYRELSHFYRLDPMAWA